MPQRRWHSASGIPALGRQREPDGVRAPSSHPPPSASPSPGTRHPSRDTRALADLAPNDLAPNADLAPRQVRAPRGRAKAREPEHGSSASHRAGVGRPGWSPQHPTANYPGANYLTAEHPMAGHPHHGHRRGPGAGERRSPVRPTRGGGRGTATARVRRRLPEALPAGSASPATCRLPHSTIALGRRAAGRRYAQPPQGPSPRRMQSVARRTTASRGEPATRTPALLR